LGIRICNCTISRLPHGLRAAGPEPTGYFCRPLVYCGTPWPGLGALCAPLRHNPAKLRAWPRSRPKPGGSFRPPLLLYALISTSVRSNVRLAVSYRCRPAFSRRGVSLFEHKGSASSPTRSRRIYLIKYRRCLMSSPAAPSCAHRFCVRPT
jgi:hypothetical protein